MSLTIEERENFCEKILKQRRIKGNIVVLCEGNANPDYLEIHTPQQMSHLDRMPDANFWLATVPRWWRNRRPVFIPCGDRGAVLACYQELQHLHRNDPDNSYLSPEKLFALIDLDIQTAKLEEICPHVAADTENLYHCMYNGLKINGKIIRDTHILITGWIHKEAYFLEPDLQEEFDKSEYQLSFNNSELRLDNIYQQMAEDLPDDADLNNHFPVISKRIGKYTDTDPSDATVLQDTWKKDFAGANGNSAKKRSLAEMLLTIRKAKPYWESMTIRHPVQQSDEQTIRDSFMLGVIAPFYSNKYSQDENPAGPYHIPQWMQILREYS